MLKWIKKHKKDGLSPGLNVALNVETDKETQKDGLSPGLNVETSLMDNSQQPVENDVRGLNIETEANTVEEMEGEVQTTETGATQDWQEDIEHLTDVTTKVNRTNAALGLLLLNSPRSMHIDTEVEELVGNELLMPVGGEKQPDMVMEIEQQNKNKTSTNTMDLTTLNNTPEEQDDVDSDGTVILETQEASLTPNKPKVGTKGNKPKSKPKKRASNGTLVIRSYKLRRKPDIATSQKNKKKLKPTVTGSKKNQNVPKLDNRPTTNKYKIKRTKQNGMMYYHCDYCVKVFDSLQHLNNHHKRNHDPVTCNVCNKNFATPNTLIRHAYGHLTKQYGCELCDQTFHFCSEVTQHMDVHVGEPRYQCKDCTKKFIRKSDLMAHAEGHTKTWTCKFAGCNKTVTDKRYLNSHYKTHNDELKYPSLKCNKRFKFNEQRKQHLSQ